jgi:FtsZ-binding cell division protein ZapB
VIEEYKDSILREEDLPPVEVYEVDGKYYLIDGFHRFYAYQKLNQSSIPTLLLKGNHSKAFQASLKANTTHGLRRSLADKHKIVRKALEDFEFGCMSDRELSYELKVSTKLIKKIREQSGIEKVPNKHTTLKNLKLKNQQNSDVRKVAHQDAAYDTSNFGFGDQNLLEKELKVEVIQTLIAENESLNHRLAIKAFTGTDEEKNALCEEVDKLKEQVKLLTIENKALTTSRNTYQQENAQLKKQIHMMNKEIKALKGKS